MSIEPLPAITKDVKEFLDNGFAEYEVEKTGEALQLFCFVIKEEQKIKGVINGYFYSGELYIKQLVVDKERRNKGLGKQLLKHVQDYSKKCGINFIWVDTLSYQAPGFYAKNGFVENGRIKKYRGDHDRIFFLKALKK